jgi:hypothetical protein
VLFLLQSKPSPPFPYGNRDLLPSFPKGCEARTCFPSEQQPCSRREREERVRNSNVRASQPFGEESASPKGLRSFPCCKANPAPPKEFAVFTHRSKRGSKGKLRKDWRFLFLPVPVGKQGLLFLSEGAGTARTPGALEKCSFFFRYFETLEEQNF